MIKFYDKFQKLDFFYLKINAKQSKCTAKPPQYLLIFEFYAKNKNFPPHKKSQQKY